MRVNSFRRSAPITMYQHFFSSLWLLLLTTTFAVNTQAAWFKYQDAIMGTSIQVELLSTDKHTAEECSQRVFNEMHRIDNLMSPYISSSELSLLNIQASSKATIVSQELFDLIERSIYFSELTQGAFDITYASVGYLYDYRQSIKPDETHINDSLDAINYRHILLDPPTHSIRFKHKDTKIDLGGIAKGYAVDNAIQLIKDCGVKNALVSAGGDSRILGDKNGAPWVMGIQHPRNKNQVVVSIPLNDSAISTSGDYERFFIESGKRYHHIIQPGSGRSVDHTWSASILAENALTSDALSTSAFVMGTEKALQLINSLDNTEAVIIDSKGKMHYSNGLMPPTTH